MITKRPNLIFGRNVSFFDQKQPIFLLLSSFILLTLTACSQLTALEPKNPIQQTPVKIETEKFIPKSSPISIPLNKQTTCKGLDSQLFQITQSSDPLIDAESKGLRIVEGKVLVLFVLSSSETAFLLDYGVELGSQSGNQVQALAPIERLCELANLDEVQAIRIPSKANFP